MLTSFPLPTAVKSFDGFILVDKPSGPTSYDMIRWVKRIVKGVKIGHCGTLDPLASGLLIILLGKATKKQSQFMGLDKTYRCHMRLGIQTDSGDITGKVIQEAQVPNLNSEMIQTIFQKMTGPQLQIPPMYSALKVQGTPLYKLARKGVVVKRDPRPIQIFSLDLLNVTDNKEIEFKVHCSSGTYVRTLVESIAENWGTCGTMSGLVRESIGSFGIAGAIPGQTLSSLSENQIWSLLKNVE